jgi:hypothetical protein
VRAKFADIVSGTIKSVVDPVSLLAKTESLAVCRLKTAHIQRHC